MNKKSVPSQVFRGITLYEHVMKVKFRKVYASDKCQQGDKNCFRYNKICYFDPSKEDDGSRKICRHIIYIYMSHNMRFPLMWYVTSKALDQPSQVTLIFCDCYATD